MNSARSLSTIVLLSWSSVFAADAPPKAATPPAPVASAEIRGQVAGADGKPIKDATVRVVESKQKMGGAGIGGKAKPVVVKTGDDGSFVATELKGPMFAVRVEHPGLAPSVSWQVVPGASLNIQLRPAAFASGRVFDAETRKPVAGASVLLWDRDASPFGYDAGRRAVTGEDGRFRIGDLPPGVAYAEVTSPAHAMGRIDQIIIRESSAAAEAVEPKEPSVYLRPGGRVGGRVIGADGKGIEGAIVSVRPVSYDDGIDYTSNPRPATTNAEGRFTIEGFPAEASKRKLAVSKEGFAGVESAPLIVEAGSSRLDLELRLETGATLKFRLVDPEDLPVADTGLRLEPPQRTRGDRGVWLDAGSEDKRFEKGPNGTFTLKALEAGMFKLTIVPEGYEDIDRDEVRLRNGETTDLGTLRLRAGRAISGAITDTSGQPIAKATVTARWMEDSGERWRLKTATTDDKGAYKLGGLSSAPLRSLGAKAKGYANKERTGGATPGDTGVDFVLEKAGTIVGKVLLADGTPPAAFSVQAHGEAKEDTRSGRSRVYPEETSIDPSGSFTLEGMGAGSVTLEVTSKGKVPARKSGIKVVSGQTVDAGTLTLVDGRTLRGRVLAASDSSPVVGATVGASLGQGTRAMLFAVPGSTGGAASGGDGSFEITGLESRRYTLSVNHPEWAPAESSIDVPEGEDPPEQTIRLTRGGALTGTVRDAAKQPVADKRIRVSQETGSTSRQATTGTDGRYSFDKLPAGTYSVMRTPDGNVFTMSNIGLKPAEVRDGETTVVDFDEAAKITVSGRVLRSGKAVSEASLVFLAGAEGGIPTEFKGAESDAEGRYQVGLDKAGPYQVMVQVGGRFAGSGNPMTIQVPDQPAVTQDIVVPGNGVAGRVIDGEGKPVSGAIVRARREGGEESSLFGSMDSSEPDGAWRIDGLEPGTYRITASASGYKNTERYPITVGADDAPGVELRLERGRSFRGRVVDPMDRPMSRAMVLVAPAGVTEMSFSDFTSDINGVFATAAPGDGALDITAFVDGYGAARAKGFVPSGESEEPEITLRLTPGGRVRVLVTGTDGKPVAGARIVGEANPRFLGSEFSIFSGGRLTTGSNGVVTLGPWTAGSYELTALEGARKGSQSVNVTDGGETRVTIVLP